MSSQQSRSGQRTSRRWPHLAIVGAVAFVALLGARPARADCAPPPPSIDFTYPNETTESVPPDAVFWVVGVEARAWIDDVPLTALGTSLVDRQQFSYPVPLTEGEHEFVAGAGNDERLSLTFRVAATPPPTANVSIDTVTYYPPSNRHPARNPPDDELDEGCMPEAISLGQGACNSFALPRKTRVTYAGQGDAIAYLVQDGYLVPPTCTGFWANSSSDPQPADYVVAAVLPTGVAEARAFDGNIDVRTLEETRPDLFDRPDACSLGFGQRPPSALASMGLALAAWLARRRRRATQ